MAVADSLAAVEVASMPAPMVYAFGSNGSGQLGIGHVEDVARPERCVFRTWMRAPGGGGVDQGTDRGGKVAQVLNVRKIVAGGTHTLVLTTGGRLFIAGKTRMRIPYESYLDVGRSIDSESESEREKCTVVFQEITHHVVSSTVASSERDVVVTDVAATWEASFAVVDSKIIVGWGSGTKGELGLGPGIISTEGKVKKIFEVDSDSSHGEAVKVEIVDIVGSMAHVVVLASDGRVYGWGSCRKGQLGQQLKTEKILWSPRNIAGGLGVDDGEDLLLLPWTPQKVVAGREYTVFVKIGRQPVIWGDTRFFDIQDSEELMVVEEGDVVTSGWSSIHVLSQRRSEQSLLQGVGRNSHGQLPPASLPPLRTVAAGSEHCVALSRDNQGIAWGWGEHGNCGDTLDQRGNVVDRYNVVPLPTLDDDEIVPKDVAAGCATSFIIYGKKDG
ncbi:hypothetical protein AYO22_10266 [Fonsecaea multimorphosa]|nr:hypothetical protein AYO22_10266 [Fonsecaea multimorphosa]